MPRNEQQLSLFDSGVEREEPAGLDTEQDAALVERVPENILFGTSSWTFPGWAGLVYPGRPSERELVSRGLETS